MDLEYSAGFSLYRLRPALNARKQSICTWLSLHHCTLFFLLIQVSLPLETSDVVCDLCGKCWQPTKYKNSTTLQQQYSWTYGHSSIPRHRWIFTVCCIIFFLSFLHYLYPFKLQRSNSNHMKMIARKIRQNTTKCDVVFYIFFVNVCALCVTDEFCCCYCYWSVHCFFSCWVISMLCSQRILCCISVILSTI